MIHKHVLSNYGIISIKKLEKKKKKIAKKKIFGARFVNGREKQYNTESLKKIYWLLKLGH